MATLRNVRSIVLIFLWCSCAEAAETAGTVVGITGQSFVQSADTRTPLKLGDTVHVADIVDVLAGAKLKLRMSDGSIISMAASSQMTIGSYSIDADGKRHNVQLSLGQGLLRAVVSPIERPATFEVKTAIGTAAVRSTDWFVEAQPGMTAVGVLSGGVALTSNKTGEEVLIPTGSGASIAANSAPTAPRAWRKAEFSALIGRTDIPRPATPKAPRRAQPKDEQQYVPQSDQMPQPPAMPYAPGRDAPREYYPREYYPAPGRYGPPRGEYSPYPRGGYPRGGYDPRPDTGGRYQPPTGYGDRPPSGTHPPSDAGRPY